VQPHRCGRTVGLVNGRQKAYLGLRGGAAGVFVISATVLPHGWPAVAGCAVAGAGGILTCIGVNAGGPGERAGALAQGVRYEEKRAPQGDWPPYPEEQVIDGEIVKE
jgi:hypothetical protein